MAEEIVLAMLDVILHESDLKSKVRRTILYVSLDDQQDADFRYHAIRLILTRRTRTRG